MKRTRGFMKMRRCLASHMSLQNSMHSEAGQLYESNTCSSGEAMKEGWLGRITGRRRRVGESTMGLLMIVRRASFS